MTERVLGLLLKRKTDDLICRLSGAPSSNSDPVFAHMLYSTDPLWLALYNKHAPSGSVYSAAKGATNGGLVTPKSTECPQATGVTLRSEQKRQTLTFLTVTIMPVLLPSAALAEQRCSKNYLSKYKTY